MLNLDILVISPILFCQLSGILTFLTDILVKVKQVIFNSIM